jgi:hypothetical protein
MREERGCDLSLSLFDSDSMRFGFDIKLVKKYEV